jgi:hypothetical protein
VIEAIKTVLKANDSKEARAAGVEYVPMAFLVEWAKIKAFNAELLLVDPWKKYICYTPSRHDDDNFQIKEAQKQLRLGHECYVVTNDNWDNHRREGTITDEWFALHVVPFMWNGRMYGTAHDTGVLLMPPKAVLLPGL